MGCMRPVAPSLPTSELNDSLLDWLQMCDYTLYFVWNTYSAEESAEMDEASFELQPVTSAGSCEEDVLLQQNPLLDAANVEEFEVENTSASQPVALMKNLSADTGKPKSSRIAVKTSVSSSLLRRLLKYTLPLPLLLLVLFGGLYLLCDGWHEALSDLGLWISPQLKHVRGAPPV